MMMEVGFCGVLVHVSMMMMSLFVLAETKDNER
jgi:hypothetical protein